MCGPTIVDVWACVRTAEWVKEMAGYAKARISKRIMQCG